MLSLELARATKAGRFLPTFPFSEPTFFGCLRRLWGIAGIMLGAVFHDQPDTPPNIPSPTGGAGLGYFFLQAGVQAQENAAKPKNWSVSWGWNRAAFTSSDIHFWGSNHDSTLNGVQSADWPDEVSLASFFDTYVNPLNMTVPQTNLRVGYVNLPDVLTSAPGDKAAQSFMYNEVMVVLGWRF